MEVVNRIAKQHGEHQGCVGLGHLVADQAALVSVGATLPRVFEFRIDFTSDDDPLVTLAAFIGLASPLFAQFGYKPEEKDVCLGKGWMHWNRGFGNVIRAYAFKDGARRGVSIVGQGEIPEGLERAVAQLITDSTEWSVVATT